MMRFAMKNRRLRQRGNAIVEACLAIPAMFILFAGVADFGRAFWAYNEAVSAARDGSQVVINHYPAYISSGSDSKVVATVAADSTLTGLAGAVTRFYTCPDPNGDDGRTQYATSQGCANERMYVKISASAPFSAATPHPMIAYPSTIRGTAVVRVQ